MRQDPSESPVDCDAELVAFIDNELEDGARSAIEARLAADPDLRARLGRLQEGGRAFAPAFQALLDDAPVGRLNAALAALDADRSRRKPRRPILSFYAVRAGAAAAAALVVFCAGIGVDRLWLAPQVNSRQIAGSGGDHDEDWRQAVAEYANLYTVDTFSTVAEPFSAQLSALGAKIGLDLTPERVALADLQFEGALILDYHGAPLGRLAYVDPMTGPVLFCIVRDSESDARRILEKREGFAVASWARAGRGYMLIGRLPDERMTEIADSLARRF